MGVCTSCCGKQEEVPQYSDSIERAHLIDENIENVLTHRCQSTDQIYTKYASGSHKSIEEESDVNIIWQEMARNVIDVGTLGSRALEQHEYRERMAHYAGKLRSLSSTRSQWSLPKCCILVDIPTPEKTLLSNLLVSNKELQEMYNAIKDIDTAFEEVKLQTNGNLLVPFKVP